VVGGRKGKDGLEEEEKTRVNEKRNWPICWAKYLAKYLFFGL